MEERETNNEERLLLFGLRSLSHADIESDDDRLQRAFMDNLSEYPEILPHFSSKKFCFKYAQSLLSNRKLEITPDHELRITDEPLAEPDLAFLTRSFGELKQREDEDLRTYSWMTVTPGIISNFQLHLSLLKYLKSKCEECGSEHRSGDIDHFNRFYITQEKRLKCYCPDCMSKIVPDFDAGLRLTESNARVLKGLEIFDRDEELRKYLVNATPADYRALGHRNLVGYYARVYDIWELCEVLGAAFYANKKIDIEHGFPKGASDGEYTKLNLR